MQKKYSQILNEIPEVISVEEISLSTWLQKKLGAQLAEARKNRRHINVYKIIYRSQKHDVVGFIVEPKKGHKLPVVIYNRGGSNELGAIKFGELFLNLAKFARWGYIVIASQYSGNAGGDGKDEHGGGDVEDVLNLYKILKKNPRADTKRIGMVGASRGGMMTYLALTRAKWIKAAVSIAGATNLIRSARLRPEMQQIYTQAFGGSTQGKKKRSALFWPEKFPKNVPILIMHGSADWRVSPLDSLELSEKLYKHQVPHRLVLFEGADHTLSEFQAEKEQLMQDWLDRYVKYRKQLPVMKPHGK